MQKVRWTQKCAGGCGATLSLGQYAWLLHGTLWCGVCARKHELTCQTIRT